MAIQEMYLDELEVISDELLQLYHRLCWGIGVTPRKTLLDDIREDYISDHDLGEAIGIKVGVVQILLEAESDHMVDYNFVKEDMISSVKEDMIDVISELLRLIIKAIGTASDTGSLEDSLAEADRTGRFTTEDLLIIKNDLIATQRQVFKVTKTVQMDIANLKSKYENEKAIVSNTMLKGNECSSLKECKESHTSWRFQFSEKCIQLIREQEDLQMVLASSEDMTHFNAFVNFISSTAAGLPDSG